MTTLTAQQIAGAAQQAGFTGNDLVIAVAVAFAESGGNTEAVNHNANGSTDYGLWQINTVHGSLLNQGDKFNPIDNARMAFTVFKGSGWRAWTTYNTGAYLPFMPRAQLAAGNPTSPGAGTATSVGLGSDNSFFGRLADIVTNKTFWMNIGCVLVGFILLGLSMRQFISGSKLEKDFVKAAATVIKVVK